MTTLVRACRVLTGRHLKPSAVHLVHRRSCRPTEFEEFLGCRIRFGAETDEIIFDRKVAQLPLVGADPYLDKILLNHCEQALAHRRSNSGSLQITIENAITPLLPHGKARFDAVARSLGVSSRTLARWLTAEGLRFGEISKRLRSDLTTHYLSEADLSISQVAWLAGFKSIGAFSHSCKRSTGLNRKRLRQKLLASC